MSLISVKKNFIFIHPYKCGGTSVKRNLESYTSDITEVLGAHSIAKHVKDHFVNYNNLKFWNKAFKFTIVRNPYSWMVSTYFYIRCSKGHAKHEEVKDLSFEQFLYWYEEQMKKEFAHGAHGYVRLIDFIKDDKVNLIDYIIKLEHYDEGMREVCGILKIKYAGNITTNKNGNYDNKKYKQFYTDEAKAKVATLFASDLQFFQYTF